MRADELDYRLPAGLIAQHPAEPRDSARLLVYERGSGAVRHRRFHDLPDELAEGDLLVVNDTRVLPVRVRARRASGGAVEVLLLEPRDARLGGAGAARTASCAKASGAGRRAGPDACSSGWGRAGCWCRPTRAGVARGGARAGRRDAAAALHHRAARRSRPLPDGVRARARLGGRAHRRPALHAPSSGSACASATSWSRSTLDVGLDTFRPLAEDDRRARTTMHCERYAVAPARRGDRRACRAAARVVAVGTTTRARAGDRVRRSRAARWRAARGCFITPGHRLPRGGRAGHQLPPAALDAARAGDGVRRRRADARAVRGRRWPSATASTALATRCLIL